MKYLVFCLSAALCGCPAATEDLLEGLPTANEPVVLEPGPMEGADSLPGTAEASDPAVGYATPDTWTSRPPSSSMRVAEWVLPGDASCALFSFPGGGSVDANFQRWLGQFEQPDGTPSADAARRMNMEVSGVAVEFLQVTGTFNAPNPQMNGPGESLPNYGLFGAVFSTEPAPYFLKCTGPAPAIQAQAEELTAFVASFVFR